MPKNNQPKQQQEQNNNFYIRALIQPETFNKENRELVVVFATETPVFRYGWEENYNEILVCDESAVRMERINKGLPVLDSHSWFSVRNQFGTTIEVWFSESREMCARIKLSQREEVKGIIQDIEDGILKEISVGYQVFKFERAEKENGELPEYRAVDWMPFEISLVPVPADINSGVRSNQPPKGVQIINISTNKNNSMRNKRSEDPKTVQYTVPENESVKKGDAISIDDSTSGIALSDGEAGDTIEVEIIDENNDDGNGSNEDNNRDAGANNDDDNDDDENKRSFDMKKAKERLAEIQKSTRAAGLSADFAIELFKSKLTISECRQKIIERKSGTDKPISGNHTANAGKDAIEKKRDAISNALLHRLDPQKFRLHTGSNEFRGMTLMEMGKVLLAERGISTNGKSKAEIAQMAFSRSHSTSDFPLIFMDVVNKTLRAEYEDIEEYWSLISRQTTNADFRSKFLYQFETANGMQEVKEGGEIKYTTFAESKESIRLKSYAEGFMYTRQSFINDDLGALERIPEQFRRHWEEKRGDLVWGVIIDNVKMGDGNTLFHDKHKNILRGPTSALSETGLSLAKEKFRMQTKLDGVTTIKVSPKYLIVPAALEMMARKLITSVTPTKTEDVNVHANSLEVIVETRLTDRDAWYLSANPRAIDSLYHAYLEGEEALRVDMEHDFNTDSIKYAVRGDFGVAVADHRGLLKSTGV